VEIAGAKIVYYVAWTEFEKGWGSRPDGCSYAIDKDKLAEEVRRQESLGDYECFSRATQPLQGIVTDALYEEIRSSKSGHVSTFRNHHPGFLGQFSPAKV